MARRMQHWHRFEVTGRGEFPVDMLRFDQCHPLYPSDTEIMRHPVDEDQVVALGRWAWSGWEPSDRWNSYGWAVTHHEAMK